MVEHLLVVLAFKPVDTSLHIGHRSEIPNRLAGRVKWGSIHNFNG